MAEKVSQLGGFAPLLSSFQALPMLDAKKAGKCSLRTSLDLGKSHVRAKLSEDGVQFETGLQIGWEAVERVSRQERKVYRLEEGELCPVQVFSEATGWLRTLCATAGAPTTLISGIPMHRIKDTDPMDDTRAKISALSAPKGRVLDTATGLGYTAILAARAATELVTIELDPAAIELARFNPWSAELFSTPGIRQIVGDSFDEVLRMDAGSFAGIIHDPPTLSLGGELYSEEFYRRIYRLLKRGGRLYHYVGDPESKLGKRTYPGVVKRLSATGFKHVKIDPASHGVTADS